MQVTAPERVLSGTDAKAIRILLVDDEEQIRAVLDRWLIAEGYECDQAADAEEAQGLLQQRHYDVLLCDIMMPGTSGVDLVLDVRRTHPDVAVIMVTGLDDPKIGTFSVKVGAYGYVTKPFERIEILMHVANAIERRRLSLVAQDHECRLEREVEERTAEVRRREEEIALRLVSASEYRDEETGAHIRRIGLYASALAEALGWDTQMVDDLRVAAPMHDIGKIGVPDTILLKPGRLTDEEFEVVKQHSEIGAKILDGTDVSLLRIAAQIALCHHEKWDGSGYPRGLRGEEIPAIARLVAIIDVYDALTTDRVYRAAMSEQDALGIMDKSRGCHFDPAMYDRFRGLRPVFRRIREQVGDRGASSRLREVHAAGA